MTEKLYPKIDPKIERLQDNLEAAEAEIERLKDRLTSMWEDKQKSNVWANAEIERLKAAIRDMANCNDPFEWRTDTGVTVSKVLKGGDDAD